MKRGTLRSGPVRDVTDLDAWATRIAESLPPLTDAEAAVVGRLAAELDARRSEARS